VALLAGIVDKRGDATPQVAEQFQKKPINLSVDAIRKASGPNKMLTKREPQTVRPTKQSSIPLTEDELKEF